jgi:hypothetical protein
VGINDGSLLSGEFRCGVLLDAIWLTTNGAEVIRPFKCVHDQVGKALGVPSQIAIGDIIQVEEIIQKVTHDAEASRCAVIVAVRGEYSSLQTPHSDHFSLGEVRRIRKYPIERLPYDSVAIVVEGKREGTGEREKVWEYEESGFEDCRNWR